MVYTPASPDAAAAAIRELHGSRALPDASAPLEVVRAKPQPQADGRAHGLLVSHLPSHVTAEQLREAFGIYGVLDEVFCISSSLVILFGWHSRVLARESCLARELNEHTIR